MTENSPELRVSVDAEDFIRIWESSENLDEVVERTGLKRSSASQRATTLRKNYGIPLKKMKGSSPHAVSRERLLEAFEEARSQAQGFDDE